MRNISWVNITARVFATFVKLDGVRAILVSRSAQWQDCLFSGSVAISCYFLVKWLISFCAPAPLQIPSSSGNGCVQIPSSLGNGCVQIPSSSGNGCVQGENTQLVWRVSAFQIVLVNLQMSRLLS